MWALAHYLSVRLFCACAEGQRMGRDDVRAGSWVVVESSGTAADRGSVSTSSLFKQVERLLLRCDCSSGFGSFSGHWEGERGQSLASLLKPLKPTCWCNPVGNVQRLAAFRERDLNRTKPNRFKLSLPPWPSQAEMVEFHPWYIGYCSDWQLLFGDSEKLPSLLLFWQPSKSVQWDLHQPLTLCNQYLWCPIEQLPFFKETMVETLFTIHFYCTWTNFKNQK